MTARTRLALDARLLAVLIGTGVVLLADAPEVVRVVHGVAAMLLVPGGALLTRIHLANPAEWVGLAIALSLALETAGCLAMVWSGWWHPEILAVVVAAVSAALIVTDMAKKTAEMRSAAPGPPRAGRVAAPPTRGQHVGLPRPRRSGAHVPRLPPEGHRTEFEQPGPGRNR